MSVNKVILVGRVGKDPEIRYIEKGLAVANFSLATTERGYTSQSGVVVPERTEWHNIIAWRGLADLAEKFIRKGSELYVEGKLQTRTWEKDGIKRYTTEIYAETINLLGKKPDHIEPLARTVVASTSVTASTGSTVSEPVSAMETPAHGEDDLPF